MACFNIEYVISSEQTIPYANMAVCCYLGRPLDGPRPEAAHEARPDAENSYPVLAETL